MLLRSALLALSSWAWLAATAPAQTFVRNIPDLPALGASYSATVNSAGDLWVACAGDQQIVKLSPTGQELARVGPRFRWTTSGGPQSLSYPRAIATGKNDEVLVFDYPYLLRFDASGSFLGWFGGQGNAAGQFSGFTNGLAADRVDGSIYIVDYPQSCIRKYDYEGNLLFTFGSAGSALGQFHFLVSWVGIAVDANQAVLVVDDGNNRVQKFKPDGTEPSAIAINDLSSSGDTKAIAVDSAGSFVLTRASYTHGLRKFSAAGSLIWSVPTISPSSNVVSVYQATGVSCDAAGNVYPCEYSGRVQKFTTNGAFVSRFGNAGLPLGTGFWNPRAVARNAAGDLFVFDNNGMQRLSQTGSVLATFTPPTYNFTPPTPPLYCSFRGPIAIDSAGDLLAVVTFYRPQSTPTYSLGVAKYSAAGALLQVHGSWTYPASVEIAAGPAGGYYVSTGVYLGSGSGNYAYDWQVHKHDASGARVLSFGGTGTADGRLAYCRGLAVAANGDILVVDNGNSRIQRFDSSGTFLSKFTSAGPNFIAIDGTGRIFVTESDYILAAFSPTGASLNRYLAKGGGAGEFGSMAGLAITGDSLAVVDSINSRIALFAIASLEQQIPTVTITSPQTGSVFLANTSVTLEGSVADESRTTVTSSPAGILTSLPAPGGTVSGTIALSNYEGVQTLTLSATDVYSNTGATSVQVVLDLYAPSVSLGITENQIVGTSSLTPIVWVYDRTATSVTISHGGGSWSVPRVGSGIGSDFSGYWYPQLTLQNGNNVVTVEATDAVGHVTRVTRTVRCDLAAPIVTILAPTQGAIFGPGDSPIAVSARIDDLTTTTLSFPSVLTGSLPAGGGIVNGTTALVEGSNSLLVKARDAYGRYGDATVSVILDTTAPTLTFESPANGALVRGSVDLAASAQDVAPGSGIAWVRFSVDGQEVATDYESPFEAVLDTVAMSVSDGSHTLTARATDGKGNWTSRDVTIFVDNTKPTATFTTPADKAIVSGTALQIAADVGDAGSGLKASVMTVGTLAPSVDGSTEYTTPLASATVTSTEDTTRWPDGALLLAVRVVDLAGIETTIYRTVTVDNTPAESSLISPTDGATVAGIVPIVVQASDPNLASIVIKVDDTVVGTTTTASSLRVDYDTSGRLAGPMRIEAVVTDLANHETKRWITVHVVNLTWEFNPKTLNLKAKGEGVVTAHVEGPTVGNLVPWTAHVFELRLPAGNSVFAIGAGGVGDGDGDTIPDMTVRFERQALIASLRGAIAVGALPATGDIDLKLVIDGAIVGTSRVRLN